MVSVPNHFNREKKNNNKDLSLRQKEHNRQTKKPTRLQSFGFILSKTILGKHKLKLKLFRNIIRYGEIIYYMHFAHFL